MILNNMKDSLSENIHIIGGGLVGSLLAILLSDKGSKVSVHEKRTDPREGNEERGRSINLALSYRGIKALKLAGLEEEVLADAVPMKGRMIHDVHGGLTFQPYGEEGQMIYSVSRANLNKSLIRKAAENPNVSFNFNAHCNSLDPLTGQISLEGPGGRTTLNAGVIFGADGAFSAVRAALEKDHLIQSTQETLEHGYKELDIAPATGGMHRMEKNALHIWPRNRFMLIALPNRDGSFTCTLFLPFEGEDSFAGLKEPQAAKEFFRKYFPDVTELLPDLETQFLANPISSLFTIRSWPWVSGRAALIGDAAHAIVPFFGQGMNAGFEDCTVLLELLEKHAYNFDSALEEFQHLRKPSADAIAELALQNFIEMRDLVADPGFILRKKIEIKMHARYKEKFLPLYSMVTFSDMPYQEAMEKGKQQEKLMEKIMAIEGVENKWMEEEFWRTIEKTLNLNSGS